MLESFEQLLAVVNSSGGECWIAGCWAVGGAVASNTQWNKVRLHLRGSSPLHYSYHVLIGFSSTFGAFSLPSTRNVSFG
jgi:hypothetical protein